MNYYEKVTKRIEEENQQELSILEKNLIEEYKIWLNKITKMRFSQESKKAFKILDKLFDFKYKYKKESEIINETINEEGNIFDSIKSCKLIGEDFQKIHKGEEMEKIEFPILEKITDKEIYNIAKKFRKLKAFSFDGITNKILNMHKKCLEKEEKCKICKKKLNLWRSLWDTNYWNNSKAKIHLEGRLIPLNKVSPDIPKPSEYRPIGVASTIWKAVEARLSNKLSEYVEKNMIKEQVGFCPKMETGVCWSRLVDEICEFKKNKNKKDLHLLFIDLKGAYDRCNRNNIYKILIDKNIINKEEVNLLKFLHNNLKIKIGNFSTYMERGLVQGSMISPFLFNIYFEDILKILKEKCDINIYAFADDLLLTTKDRKNLINAYDH